MPLRRVVSVPWVWMRAVQDLPALHEALRDVSAGARDAELERALAGTGLEATPERLALMRRLLDGRNRPPAPS